MIRSTRGTVGLTVLFLGGGCLLGGLLWRVGDQTVIDGAVVNGSARAVGVVAVLARGLQSGYLYHYAFAMVVGLAALVGWLVFR